MAPGFDKFLMNQCDGCMAGHEVNARGNHVDKDGKSYMRCQVDKYVSLNEQFDQLRKARERVSVS